MIDIEKNFTYHAPTQSKISLYSEIRLYAKKMAELFEMNCPESREKSLAMTKLEEAVMWANASIARND